MANITTLQMTTYNDKGVKKGEPITREFRCGSVGYLLSRMLYEIMLCEDTRCDSDDIEEMINHLKEIAKPMIELKAIKKMAKDAES